MKLDSFLIVDTKNLQTIPPSDTVVKKYKSKEVEVLKKNKDFVFQCRTGEILQEGQPSSTTGGATSCGDLSKFLQKKKKKPEI